MGRKKFSLKKYKKDIEKSSDNISDKDKAKIRSIFRSRKTLEHYDSDRT